MDNGRAELARFHRRMVWSKQGNGKEFVSGTVASAVPSSTHDHLGLRLLCGRVPPCLEKRFGARGSLSQMPGQAKGVN